MFTECLEEVDINVSPERAHYQVSQVRKSNT